jgi:hypothetical protein
MRTIGVGARPISSIISRSERYWYDAPGSSGSTAAISSRLKSTANRLAEAPMRPRCRS